jgi:hypothetical protein
MGLTVEQLQEHLPEVDEGGFQFDDAEIKFVTSPEHSFKSVVGDDDKSEKEGFPSQSQRGSREALSTELKSRDRGFGIGNVANNNSYRGGSDESLRHILTSLIALPQFKDALAEIGRSSAPTSRDDSFGGPN